MEERIENTKNKNVAAAYQQMERLPGQLSFILNNYSRQVQKETERHDYEIIELERAYRTKKDGIEKQKTRTCFEADENREITLTQLGELKERKEQSDADYENALRLVPKSRKKEEFALGKGLTQVLQKIQAKQGKNQQEFETAYARVIELEKRICDEAKRNANQLHDTQLSAATEEFSKELKDKNQKSKECMEAIYDSAKKMLLDLKPENLHIMYDMLQTNIPAVMNFTTAKEMPAAIEMGYLGLDFDDWRKISHVEPMLELIREHFSFAFRNINGKMVLQLPYGRAFDGVNFNKLIAYDDSCRQQAFNYIRALEMRLFMSVPCGKLRVTMIDPRDLGSNFSMFSCLGDDDERIISTKIWSEPKRIKEQLNLLIGQIAHVNQDCLRSEFENIVEYNAYVGKNAEPLQALFIADFPRHFDQESCEMLEKIVNSGPKCGIYTFIAGSESDIKESDYAAGIVQAMEQMTYHAGKLQYQFGNMNHSVNPVTMPSREEQKEIFEVLKKGIKTSDMITINYDEITDNLTKHPEKWFKFSDENGLDIPIGLEGAARTVQLHLGGDLITRHHALISGTIGSGKSTLLHTIIMSILLNYSPEDVQIYLLDFKRGIEFKIYAESKLPNFRVIALDTEPEFALTVLKDLDTEQENRALEFHDNGCEGIEGYNEKVNADLGGNIRKISRNVLIIDEFHEMFSNPESEVAKECGRLLERIVKQGRALGNHVILASQTLPDHLSEMYGQVLNRIALQSTAASAKYILDADNEAVNTLVNVDPGKGVFNDGGGNKDANHPFRVAYFSSDEQRTLLERIRVKQEELYGHLEMPKPRLLLSSIQDDKDHPLNRFVETGLLPQKLELGCPLYLGEEIAMVNGFSIRLTSRKAQNLLILGSDYKRAKLLYGFSAMSILFHAFRQSENGQLPNEPIITYFDFGKSSSQSGYLSKNNIDIMNELSARFPQAIRVFGKDSLMDGIDILQKECAQNNPQTRHYVIFAGLNRARRLLDFDHAYAMSPKQMFSNLVKNGPQSGYNFIIWANEPGSFCEFYGDLLPEFDYRLVYNLKEEEYKVVIKSTEMNTDFGNNNAISYNPDEDNKIIRIYSMPLFGWFKQFMNRLEGKKETLDDEFLEEAEFADDF